MPRLSLKRRPGESIAIDQGRIMVRIVRVDRGDVHLVIEAPAAVRVDRTEVFQEKAGLAAAGQAEVKEAEESEDIENLEPEWDAGKWKGGQVGRGGRFTADGWQK